MAAGIAVAPPEAEILLVHDGARPLVTPEIVASTIAALEVDPLAVGAVVGQPAIDTLKIADGDGHRRDAGPLEATGRCRRRRRFARRRCAPRTRRPTRTGSSAPTTPPLVEHAGGRVLLVEGPRDNIKVTVAEDLALVEATLAFRASGEE